MSKLENLIKEFVQSVAIDRDVFPSYFFLFFLAIFSSITLMVLSQVKKASAFGKLFAKIWSVCKINAEAHQKILCLL